MSEIEFAARVGAKQRALAALLVAIADEPSGGVTTQVATDLALRALQRPPVAQATLDDLAEVQAMLDDLVTTGWLMRWDDGSDARVGRGVASVDTPSMVQGDGRVILPEFVREALAVDPGEKLAFDQRGQGPWRLLTIAQVGALKPATGTRCEVRLAQDGSVALPAIVRDALNMAEGEFVYFVTDGLHGFRVVPDRQIREALGDASEPAPAAPEPAPAAFALGGEAYMQGTLFCANPFAWDSPDARAWAAGWLEKRALQSGMDALEARARPGEEADLNLARLAARAIALCAAWWVELRASSARADAARAWAEADRWSAFARVFSAVAQDPTVRAYGEALGANVPPRKREGRST